MIGDGGRGNQRRGVKVVFLVAKEGRGRQPENGGMGISGCLKLRAQPSCTLYCVGIVVPI